MSKDLKMSDIIQAYADNKNIMKLLREEGGNENTPLAVQISYDLQAGSYTKSIKIPQNRDSRKNNAAIFAEIMNPYLKEPSVMLEAGVGEASTLPFLQKRLNYEHKFFGLDISWSRLHYARAFLKNEQTDEVSLFMADMSNIPLPDSSIDLVYTVHSIEPNHGREEEILKELYRVTSKTLILFEPAYEQADETARKRMDEFGYARGLPDIAIKNGWNLKENKMIINMNANPTAVTVIEKNSPDSTTPDFTCPSCGSSLISEAGHLFCATDGVVYPVLKDIPCLLPTSTIIATKYMDQL